MDNPLETQCCHEIPEIRQELEKIPLENRPECFTEHPDFVIYISITVVL